MIETRNESGWKPVEYKVLVFPHAVEEVSKGGIILATAAVEKEKHAQSEGTIVAVGDMSFTDPTWPNPPVAGDIVLFDRYAGSLIKGKDGKEYRLITTKR